MSPANARGRGKPEAFTAEENAVLQRLLRELKDRNAWTGRELGVAIGVSQQTAARLSGRAPTGFSRPTALRLAQYYGFDSPESLLREHGSLAPAAPSPIGTAWMWRETAAKHAANVGVSDLAIQRVKDRYAESQFATRSMVWWVEKYTREQLEHDEEKRVPAAPPSQARGEQPRSRRPRQRIA